MKLYIEVELGNDVMMSAVEAKNAIESSLLAQSADCRGPLHPHEAGSIRDANGNTVGSWNVGQ